MFPQMWKNENYKVVKGRKLGKIDIRTPRTTINPFFKNYKFFFSSLSNHSGKGGEMAGSRAGMVLGGAMWRLVFFG